MQLLAPGRKFNVGVSKSPSIVWDMDDGFPPALALEGGCRVNWHTVETELDQCPDCGDSLEIAAVRVSFFRRTAMLFVCPNCGLMRADSSARNSISDWIAALDRTKSIAASRDLKLGDPTPIHPAGSQIVFDVSNASNKTLGVKYSTIPK